MQRTLWTLLLVGVLGQLQGCRACNSCHDYDPPVAACDCNRWDGGYRAGSASGSELADLSDVPPAEPEFSGPAVP